MSVVVRNLTKQFERGGAPAAHDVSFEAPSGKVTSLLGPSGSGKSTVLRMIAGLEVPDGGTVAIDGQDLTRVPVQRREVGFVFQGYALFPSMTVRENIGFGLSVRKVQKAQIQARVDELLALISLRDLGHRLPAQLSGGQRQRVALARALATDPKVLLLDEPFGALDTKVRAELREWLADFHTRTKVTTILVTHDQDEALELSQHAVILKSGRVEQAGSPHELYDHPKTPFVASFLGGANVISATLEGGHARVGPLSIPAPSGGAHGASAQAMVRPHDVRIEKASSSTGRVAESRVVRITRVGGMVKLQLRLVHGELMNVELSKGELDSLGIAEGDQVFVDLKNTKVFVEDHVI